MRPGGSETGGAERPAARTRTAACQRQRRRSRFRREKRRNSNARAPTRRRPHRRGAAKDDGRARAPKVQGKSCRRTTGAVPERPREREHATARSRPEPRDGYHCHSGQASAGSAPGSQATTPSGPPGAVVRHTRRSGDRRAPYASPKSAQETSARPGFLLGSATSQARAPSQEDDRLERGKRERKKQTRAMPARGAASATARSKRARPSPAARLTLRPRPAALPRPDTRTGRRAR